MDGGSGSWTGGVHVLDTEMQAEVQPQATDSYTRVQAKQPIGY